MISLYKLIWSEFIYIHTIWLYVFIHMAKQNISFIYGIVVLPNKYKL